MLSRDGAEQLMLDCYHAGLRSVEPGTAVRRYLHRDGRSLVLDGPRQRWPVEGRVSMAAVGKAAVEMAVAAEHTCGDLVHDGVVITKDGHGHGQPLQVCQLFEAGHPVPDVRGERATQEILHRALGLGRNDVLLALISGGGSALLEAPRPPVTLDDLRRTTDLLLRAGAPIQDLNAVRIPLSRVKGGGLRRAAAPAMTITLILSDVLGNDPRVIASGPTVDGEREDVAARRGRDVLTRLGLAEQVPSAVRQVLQRFEGGDAGWPGDDCEEDGAPPAAPPWTRIIGDNQTMVTAATRVASERGVAGRVIWSAKEGEASELGRAWVAVCRDAPQDVDLLLGGGEATVRVRGDGVGGRNTEFALAAALELARTGEEGWAVASLATDGQDGPTGVAGSIADGETVARARDAGIDPERALRENDSLRVFEAAGGLVQPGPTGTNVNDLYLAVRVARGSR
jgi:glycerate 2-kinase